MTGLSSSCGACKFLRRRCSSDCVFAPYFCYEQAATHFAAVHKVFGASNVSKLLLHLPLHSRGDAAITVSYEALARMHDPIYGCVAHIFALQQQVASLKEEIEIIGSQMANLGVDVASFMMPFDPYFAIQSEFTNTGISQQSLLPILPSEDASENQAISSHMETEDDITRLLEELNHDYYMQSIWMKNAEP
ncbi:hypothetical protein CDL12_20741 [Handroanthus impetiginosus]|uniref:LOB domain-containing protein n=1 Tax=Handroanthus impetiginosus TaxID=429701 RepID=A0A2G9GN36_9LAMI|nr:hypothetical protein CDL12_20741 [Handroanthus impetiginosus]